MMHESLKGIMFLTFLPSECEIRDVASNLTNVDNHVNYLMTAHSYFRRVGATHKLPFPHTDAGRYPENQAILYLKPQLSFQT